MLCLALSLVALAVLALDQLSKAAVCRQFADYVAAYTQTGLFSGVRPSEQLPVLDGVVHITFQPNTGAAFSIGTGRTWFFILITFVFFAVVIYALRKKWFRGLSLWALAMVVGGAVGNLLDRILRGFVVDMIEVEFISFPVFNVADCFICIGGALLVLAVLTEGKSCS